MRPVDAPLAYKVFRSTAPRGRGANRAANKPKVAETTTAAPESGSCPTARRPGAAPVRPVHVHCRGVYHTHDRATRPRPDTLFAHSVSDRSKTKATLSAMRAAQGRPGRPWAQPGTPGEKVFRPANSRFVRTRAISPGRLDARLPEGHGSLPARPALGPIGSCDDVCHFVPVQRSARHRVPAWLRHRSGHAPSAARSRPSRRDRNAATPCSSRRTSATSRGDDRR